MKARCSNPWTNKTHGSKPKTSIRRSVVAALAHTLERKPNSSKEKNNANELQNQSRRKDLRGPKNERRSRTEVGPERKVRVLPSAYSSNRLVSPYITVVPAREPNHVGGSHHGFQTRLEFSGNVERTGRWKRMEGRRKEQKGKKKQKRSMQQENRRSSGFCRSLGENREEEDEQTFIVSGLCRRQVQVDLFVVLWFRVTSSSLN